MNTSCHGEFHCVPLVHIQLQILCHNLFAHVVLSCRHMQVQWYMLCSSFHVKFHLQKSTEHSFIYKYKVFNGLLIKVMLLKI